MVLITPVVTPLVTIITTLADPTGREKTRPKVPTREAPESTIELIVGTSFGCEFSFLAVLNA